MAANERKEHSPPEMNETPASWQRKQGRLMAARMVCVRLYRVWTGELFPPARLLSPARHVARMVQHPGQPVWKIAPALTVPSAVHGYYGIRVSINSKVESEFQSREAVLRWAVYVCLRLWSWKAVFGRLLGSNSR